MKSHSKTIQVKLQNFLTPLCDSKIDAYLLEKCILNACCLAHSSLFWLSSILNLQNSAKECKKRALKTDVLIWCIWFALHIFITLFMKQDCCSTLSLLSRWSIFAKVSFCINDFEIPNMRHYNPLLIWNCSWL